MFSNVDKTLVDKRIEVSVTHLLKVIKSLVKDWHSSAAKSV